MLEKFTYTNHMNEVLEFGKGSLFVNENDLRDFAWEITSKNNKISGFKKGIVSKTIPIILKCETEAEGITLRNRLFEVFEKDILAQKYGKIQIGDYYLRCYITGSKKTNYLIHSSYMLMSVTVETDLPVWVKETVKVFDFRVETTSPYLDFPIGFPYDYKNSFTGSEIDNAGFMPSNFIITIFGYAQNPTIYIGGHMYSVDVVVGVNEYLTVDSAKKTVVLTKSNGEQVNCFNNRSRESYVFEKIPVGTNSVKAMSQDIYFEVALLEERSEPKWT